MKNCNETKQYRRFPNTSYFHRKSIKNNNYNIWRTWLYQREIGCQPPLGFRDRQNKDTYTAIYPTTSWNTKDHEFNHGAIFNLEFSPDGKLLVAACEAKSFLVFDPLNGHLINNVRDAHSDCVNCIRFLDSRVFATCSDDKTVALWDIRFPKHKIRSLRGHSNWVKNIEYANNSRLLVSSGFDGSVFVWDINRYTEDIEFNQVCHIDGLTRTKLTPDESKLVMCTTAGYMMVIHDLDLSTLVRDLNAFNPNTYRLMQLSGRTNRRACAYNHLFSYDRRRNRVEFIGDFPDANAAEVISSLQIHPHGWCALSRNTSSDKLSEWTCIHDLQDFEHHSPEDEYETNLPAYPPVPNIEEPQRNRPFLRFHLNYHSSAGEQNPGNSSTENQNQVDVEVELINSVPHVLTPSVHAIEINRSQLANALEMARSALNEAETVANGQQRPLEINRPTLLLQAISELVSESDSQPNTSNSSIAESEEDKLEICVKIRKNRPRLTHFVKEVNVGQSFIKELCFSTDGRLVCSPFVYGIRLFAFDADCRELCDSVPSEPQMLHEVMSNSAHSNVVVSTKYSPTYPLIVSGCLDGKVCFHQPVLQ